MNTRETSSTLIKSANHMLLLVEVGDSEVSCSVELQLSQ